jgi:hypothetical protein
MLPSREVIERQRIRANSRDGDLPLIREGPDKDCHQFYLVSFVDQGAARKKPLILATKLETPKICPDERILFLWGQLCVHKIEASISSSALQTPNKPEIRAPSAAAAINLGC